jgi:HSF-type DNA-binding
MCFKVTRAKRPHLLAPICPCQFRMCPIKLKKLGSRFIEGQNKSRRSCFSHENGCRFALCAITYFREGQRRKKIQQGLYSVILVPGVLKNMQSHGPEPISSRGRQHSSLPSGLHSLDIEITDIPSYVCLHGATLAFPAKVSNLDWKKPVENVDSFQLLSKKLMLMMLHIERMAAITSGSGPEAAPLVWGKCRNNNRDIDTVIFNDPKTFVGKVLPAFGCPPTSFNSFVRKMYRWGFRRAQLDDGKANARQPCERSAYACDHFRRGDFSRLALMVSTDSRAKNAETQSTKPADTTSDSTEAGDVHSEDNEVQKKPRKRRARPRDSIVSRGATVDVNSESIGGSPRDLGADSRAGRAHHNPAVDHETSRSTGHERRVSFAEGYPSFARPHKRFFNSPTCLLPPLPPGRINHHPSLADGIHQQEHFQQSQARNFSFQSQLFPSHQYPSPLLANQLPVSSSNLALPSSLRSHPMLTNGPWSVANASQTADILRSAVDLSLAAEHARRQQRIREGLLLLTAMREPAASLTHSLEPTPKISEAAVMLSRPHHETRELSTGLINGLSEDQLEALLRAQQRR